MCWEGFAKELTAEPKGAKCWKRWSSSGQVPALVPMAKLKLNLLSAPLKLVSQDSELSLFRAPIHHLSRDQRETPQRSEDQSSLRSHWSHQGPTIPVVTLSISTVVQNEMQKCRRLRNYSVLQKKRGEISKVKTLITVFRRIQDLSCGPVRKKKKKKSKHTPDCLSAQHQTPCFNSTYEQTCNCLQTPPSPPPPPPSTPHPHPTTVQSIQLKYVTFHTQR